jgi:pyruvate/2-oxoglutarate dehydrogenase complex dihydrolipoamide acyltransferase (E2) component
VRQQRADYLVVPYPKIRRWMVAMFRSVRSKHITHSLIEADVSETRARLSERKVATGETLSFTAFLIASLAKAIEEHKGMQAYRQGNKRLVLFEDVDVWTPIEHDLAGQKQIFPTIIRAAQRKTVREIHQEIRTAQRRDMLSAIKRLRSPPNPLFRLYFWIFSWRGRRDPQVWKQAVGTVGVTAIGMFGGGSGWGIPIPAPVTMVTVGGIGQKPVIVDGQMIPREYLSLTISVDQEIVDSSLVARFARRLKELIESGYGLSAATAETEQASEHASEESASQQKAGAIHA